ncbi:hypothetical protein A2229_04110 [Candidatus Peregrinibacteria bacterium RIFOXYA2_FULL_33_7]|nr:MAG: hypothetical protein A2229_04110 [Candidatus Peregrinibacteria bacterium RIFOXYA2_FULL_33_7]
MLEFVISLFLDNLKAALNNNEKKARKLLPLFLTIFLFLFIANNFSLLPLFTSIITEEKTAIFRTPPSHFGLTVALALGVVVTSHIMALIISPFKHIGNFIKIMPLLKARSIKDLLNALLEIFLGVLDIVGEIAKVLSLSARLFGNIFAGEVMVMIITSLAVFTHYIVPMPFIFLSAFSGLVHAFVFPLLALQFMCGTIRSVQS